MNPTSVSRQLRQFAAAAMAAVLALYGLAGHTADLPVHVTDRGGNPLANTVIMATWPDAPAPRATGHPQMRQRDMQFVPHVLVVPQHSKVAFPNMDKTRHHVYAFSRAKTFNIKLYAGVPRNPVDFHTTGVVALGCNIHDQMQGYIVVTDAPRWIMTDANGRATLPAIPGAGVTLSVWHPWMKSEQARVTHKLAAGENRIELQLDVAAPAAPAKSGKSTLQDRFNSLAN